VVIYETKVTKAASIVTYTQPQSNSSIFLMPCNSAWLTSLAKLLSLDFGVTFACRQ